MPQNLQTRADMPLVRLALPIYLENLLRTTLSSVDVFMLSSYSPEAVAAVGLVIQFTFFIQLLYFIAASGAGVLISQYLGAGREDKAGEAGLAAAVLSTAFALGMSVVTVAAAGPILSLYALEPTVHRYAFQYLVIYGACSILPAFNIVQATILRSYGYSKDSMYASMTANLVNVVGNSFALYGWFGLPVLGVSGVAASTAVSQAVACAILAVRIRTRREIVLPWRRVLRLPRAMYRKLLSIGVPTAGENLSYNIMQIFQMAIITRFGTAAISAHTYGVTLLRFAFIPTLSVGSATQIKIGYLVGAGRLDDAYRKVFRYYGAGFALSLGLILALNLLKTPAIELFTHDPLIVALTSAVLLISVLRETGRVSNIVIISGLKGAGDVRFPVFAGMAFMWGIGLGGAYLAGVTFGLGLAGVWLAIAADEWLRGIVMAFRWRSGAWRNKSLVESKAAVPA
jgi:putative MATE family efflux protein